MGRPGSDGQDGLDPCQRRRFGATDCDFVAGNEGDSAIYRGKCDRMSHSGPARSARLLLAAGARGIRRVQPETHRTSSEPQGRFVTGLPR